MKRRNSRIKNNKKSAPYFFPLIFILAVIPLIVYGYSHTNDLDKYSWYSGPVSCFEMFLHSKMIWLNITFVFILFTIFYMKFCDEKKLIFTKLLIPIGVYGALCILATITSVDVRYSLDGVREHFESIWILLGYVLLVFFGLNTLNTEESIKRIMPWFMGGITLMTVFGLLQAFKLDPLRMEWVQRLYLDHYRVGRIHFNFEEGRSYMSLYNPNYVGYYVALVLPIVVMLIIHEISVLKNTASKVKKCVILLVFYTLLALGLVYVLFASQSRAGLVAVAIGLFMLVLCMRKIFFKNKKSVILSLGILGVFGITFLAFNFLNHNILWNRIQEMFRSEPQYYSLEGIACNKDVTFYYMKNELHVTAEPDDAGVLQFHLIDQNKKEVSFKSIGEQTYQITDKRFPFTIRQVNDRHNFKGFVVTTYPDKKDAPHKEPREWLFSNQMKGNDKSYYYRGLGSSFFHLTKEHEGVPFLEEHHYMANKRGMLWSRTIPLLKKYFLLGSGPDTYLIVFDNQDVVGFYNSGRDNKFVTKPHSWYLQVAVQTGVPSLVALLIFLFWYIGSSIKLYWKDSFNTFLSKIGVGIMVSVIGYMILGLTNDSTITVSPIFFALVGMGLGINYRIKHGTSFQ